MFDAVGYADFAEQVLPAILKAPSEGSNILKGKDANACEAHHAQRLVSTRPEHDLPISLSAPAPMHAQRNA